MSVYVCGRVEKKRPRVAGEGPPLGWIDNGRTTILKRQGGQHSVGHIQFFFF
jgi:hypothetical protein